MQDKPRLTRSKKYYQGIFCPQNPDKYIGDPNNIVYRSGLEFKVFRWLDRHPDIINWASEEFHIPYLSPKDGKWHRYFPDLFITKREKNNTERKMVIEIKPHSQTQKPKIRTTRKANKRMLEESITYAVNTAKWGYAREFCRKRGMEFRIMTEKEIG